jgi:hypothetical protein
MLEKVHRIQEAGLEVWSGMIVGFDNDDIGIFDAQIRFVRDARIVNCMVNMLVAVPKTPLHDRLRREGRVDSDDLAPYRTNVIPLRMSREELRDGYVAVMRELYEPAAYLDRVDALFVDAGVHPEQARRRHLKQHPWRRRAYGARLLAEAGFIFLRLMGGVADPDLRREYRTRIWRILKTRLDPALLQLYTVKCAMHYHAHTMVHQMLDGGPVINSF